MKTFLIIGSIVIFVLIVVFLWMFIARADQSRMRGNQSDTNISKTENESSIDKKVEDKDRGRDRERD